MDFIQRVARQIVPHLLKVAALLHRPDDMAAVAAAIEEDGRDGFPVGLEIWIDPEFAADLPMRPHRPKSKRRQRLKEAVGQPKAPAHQRGHGPAQRCLFGFLRKLDLHLLLLQAPFPGPSEAQAKPRGRQKTSRLRTPSDWQQ